MFCISFPLVARNILTVCCLLLLSPARAEILYSTDFESFTLGDDTIVNTDNWLGTTSATAAGRSGVSGETGTIAHGVPGLGKAAWIGGNTAPVTLQAPNINVRRPVRVPAAAYDPVAQNKEIIYITCLLGIKDSTGTTLPLLRDDFEIFIANGNATVLAALQFDNNTMNFSATPPVPQQYIFRSTSTAGSTTLSYANTQSYYI